MPELAVPEYIRALPVRDQMLHAIGRAAQAQVGLEQELREVHRVLVGPSLAVALATERTGISPLRNDCLAMLKELEPDEPLESIVKGALRAAADADELRHRSVHDLWFAFLTSDPDKPLLISMKYKRNIRAVGTIQSLDYLHDAVEALTKSRASASVPAHVAAADPAVLG